MNSKLKKIEENYYKVTHHKTSKVFNTLTEAVNWLNTRRSNKKEILEQEELDKRSMKSFYSNNNRSKYLYNE